MTLSEVNRRGLDAAIKEAELGWAEGGIPIGSALLDRDGKVVASGRNRRVQDGDPTAHAEMVCLRAAGRRRDWQTLTLVSTLSPCVMCTGAALLFRIPTVVIGENQTFRGAEDLFRSNGAQLIVVDDPRCVELMKRLQAERPDLWAEDIGL
jgi:cytosine deaminase